MRTFKIKDGENELTFEIQKMSATQAESWMLKAVFVLGSGLELGAGDFDAKKVVNSLLKCGYKEAQPLLDDLLHQCYRVVGNQKLMVDYETADTYITSPLTLMRLRFESLSESFGFFTDGKALDSLGLGSFLPTAKKSEA